MSLITDLAQKVEDARQKFMASTEQKGVGTLEGLKAILQKKQQDQMGPIPDASGIKPMNTGAS